MLSFKIRLLKQVFIVSACLGILLLFCLGQATTAPVKIAVNDIEETVVLGTTALNIDTEVNLSPTATSQGMPAALITVLVTNHQTGAPMTNLGASVGNGTSVITLPTGWTLDASLNLASGCSIVPTQFVNVGNGLYTIRIMPVLLSGSTSCVMPTGDYHYIVQIDVSNPTRKGSALGVVEVTQQQQTLVLLDPYQFSDISTFGANPTNQFIIDSVGLAAVSRAHPFKGAGTNCSHQGAHLNFTNTGAPYTVQIYAPANGIIDRVDRCMQVGSSSDRYGFSLAFAHSGADLISFEFSLEPQDGYNCLSGNSNFYTPYIFVTEGQQVSKGDVLGLLLKTNNGNDAAHIHFHLTKLLLTQGQFNNTFHCPNIFDAATTTTFGTLYGSENCNGTSFPTTFCYCPASGEDLTGLSSCTAP